MTNQYDIIIVGGGVTGLAGAMYAGRMGLKTLILAGELGGTIILTDVVENYPGFKKLTGQELADKLKEHALEYKIDLVEEKAIDIKKAKNCFKVTSGDKKVYQSATILFATGTKHRKLNIPGEDEFFNNGVHTCALCDGPMYKNKILAVIGGSDSAAKEALLLTQYAKKVYIIYRKEKIRPEPINFERVERKIKQGKIEIINNTNLKEIKGDKFVNKIVLDKQYKGSNEFKCDAVFIEVGSIPLSELAIKVGVKVNKKKELIINRNSETNVKGFYSAGDVADTEFKQAITGVAEAVAAVYHAYKYINENELVCPTSDE